MESRYGLTEELREVLIAMYSLLSPITSSLKRYIDSGLNMDIEGLDNLGHELVLLSERFSTPLSEFSHSILTITLMNAGLSISRRVEELRIRRMDGSDIAFLNDIYSLIRLIENTIESGEYYRELVKIYQKISEDRRIHK